MRIVSNPRFQSLKCSNEVQSVSTKHRFSGKEYFRESSRVRSDIYRISFFGGAMSVGIVGFVLNIPHSNSRALCLLLAALNGFNLSMSASKKMLPCYYWYTGNSMAASILDAHNSNRSL